MAKPARALHALLTTALLLVASGGDAMIFPHLDYSAHLERGRPGSESFGSLLPDATEPPPGPLVPADGPYGTVTPGMAPLIERYDRQLAEQRHAAAVETARALLDRVAEDLGRNHAAYGHALSDLGAALHHAGRHAEAIEPLEASIEMMARAEGLFTASVIGAHAYLGAAFQALERHDEALDAFTRSQHITHRHHGALNRKQIKLLIAKAESLDALDRTWEAEQVLRAAVRIGNHHHGELSEEALPLTWYLAEWLTARGEYEDALSLYGDRLRSLAAAGDEASPAVVKARQGMATTYLLQQDVDVDRGLSLSRDVAAIMARFPERFEPAERILAELTLGDWLILFEREEEAWAAYARAWELAAAEPDRERWARHLAEPRLIYGGPNLTVDFMGYQVIGREVYNDFSFRVRRDGRPSHVRVLDSNLSTLTRRRAIGFHRLARFRPALVDGHPVSHDDFRFRRYYPTEAPEDYGQVIVNRRGSRGPMTRFERRWPGRR